MTRVAQPLAGDRRAGYLYGPYLDFLLLGGGSLLGLTILFAILNGNPDGVTLSAGYSLVLANLVNHPHFAHSYQIFYGGFRQKVTSYPAELRRLYLLCGVVVPIVLAGLLALPVVMNRPDLLGLAVNVMGFFVGWHYVKQGYGMAMLDAVLKRSFFNDAEKKILLHNAYAVWILSWLYANYTIGTPRLYWNIPYNPVPVPLSVLWLAAAVAAFTGLKMGQMLWRRGLAQQLRAWNGITAYLVSLYVWLLVRHPIVLLWVPLFHSLQYLAVVWRYRINRESSSPSLARPAFRFTFFILAGIALGYAGFSVAPAWLTSHVAYDRSAFGPSLFLFMFWIFINIHHYFLDTVMWRKGNPDVQRYLFSN